LAIFWNVALDKFGTPTVVGTYNRGASQPDIDKLLQAIEAIATDSGIAIPEGMKVALLEAAAKGDAGFEKLVRYCDEQIAKIVLSQTMTSSDGSSNAQAQVHAGVKLQVVTGDADLVCESFNEGPSRWWTDFNYGSEVAAPQLVRLLDEEDDLKARADTDETLDRAGWVRTEESFKDTYGDGYERKPTPKPVDPAASGTAPGDKNEGGEQQDDDNVVPLRRVASFAEYVAELRAHDDIVDQAAQELIAGDGYEALTPIMAPIADAIATAESAEEVNEALIRSLSQSDVDRLTETLARAGFAVRVAAETGADQ
jgi:phage gp29-like protein